MSEAESVSRWLHQHAMVLRTLEPEDEDFSDLQPLRDLIGDARVVGIGESGHYIHECLLLRSRLTRFLITELGFDAVTLESGLADSFTVNEWVHGGPGDLEDVSRRGINYGFGQCVETRDRLLPFLRAWNEHHGPQVSFYGLDMPGGVGGAAPAIGYCLEFLDRVEPATATWFRNQFAPILEKWERPTDFAAIGGWNELAQRDKDLLMLRTTELAGRLAAGRVPYARESSLEDAELALRAGINARQGVYNLYSLFSGGVLPGPEAGARYVNPRDAGVWENLQWVLERHHRVVLLYANGHIQRCGFAGGMMQSTLGEHIAATPNPRYVVIGTTFGSGEILHMAPEGVGMEITAPRVRVAPIEALEGTVDAVLEQGPKRPYLLDLRGLRAVDTTPALMLGATTMMTSNVALPTDVLSGFDALVHLPHASVAHIDRSYLTENYSVMDS